MLSDCMLSEGFWTCLGALIGGSIGAITTYYTTKRMSKLELKKIQINYLNQKKYYLERAKNSFPFILSGMNIEFNDVLNMTQSTYSISQYIPIEINNEIMKKTEQLYVFFNENGNSQQNQSPFETQMQIYALYKNINSSIESELNKTIMDLQSLLK